MPCNLAGMPADIMTKEHKTDDRRMLADWSPICKAIDALGMAWVEPGSSPQQQEHRMSARDALEELVLKQVESVSVLRAANADLAGKLENTEVLGCEARVGRVTFTAGTRSYHVIREAIKLAEAGYAVEDAAAKTLQSMGYTWNGGEYWKPPLGKAPDFDKIGPTSSDDILVRLDRLRKTQRGYGVAHTLNDAWNEITQLRAGGGATSWAQDGYARTWFAIVRLLDELVPKWIGHEDTAANSALAAIRELHAKAAPTSDAHPEAIRRNSIIAWNMVCDVLQSISPGWMDALGDNENIGQRAVSVIRAMAEKQPAESPLPVELRGIDPAALVAAAEFVKMKGGLASWRPPYSNTRFRADDMPELLDGYARDIGNQRQNSAHPDVCALLAAAEFIRDPECKACQPIDRTPMVGRGQVEFTLNAMARRIFTEGKPAQAEQPAPEAEPELAQDAAWPEVNCTCAMCQAHKFKRGEFVEVSRVERMGAAEVSRLREYLASIPKFDRDEQDSERAREERFMDVMRHNFAGRLEDILDRAEAIGARAVLNLSPDGVKHLNRIVSDYRIPF